VRSGQQAAVGGYEEAGTGHPSARLFGRLLRARIRMDDVRQWLRWARGPAARLRDQGEPERQTDQGRQPWFHCASMTQGWLPSGCRSRVIAARGLMGLPRRAAVW
jgi:hypothetical protein